MATYHGNPQPSFLGVITHILGVENLHFLWFWGPRVHVTADFTQTAQKRAKGFFPMTDPMGGTVYLPIHEWLIFYGFPCR